MKPRNTKRQSISRAWLLIGLSAWFSLVLGTATSAAMQDIEYQVKAAFMYNFAKFAVWPEAVFSSDGEPLTMCVIGSSDLVDVLQDSIVGREIQGRKVDAQSVVADNPPLPCRIVFIDASQDDRVARIMLNLRGRAVLSIGESTAFAASGGMIRLVTEGGKIRFDINSQSARRSGLRLRSQLLSLARHVEQ